MKRETFIEGSAKRAQTADFFPHLVGGKKNPEEVRPRRKTNETNNQ
jgi:hypothetical protein